jgi:bile acid-coenzyme A ligase
MAHPGVHAAVVIGLPKEDLGAVAHAIIQLNRAWNGTLTAELLLEFLDDRLVKYKLPRSFEFVDTDLRDEGGKVRRSQLREERMSCTAA